MRTFRLAVPALAVCLALGACGGQGTGDGSLDQTGAAPMTTPFDPDPTTPGTVPSTGPGDPIEKTAPVAPPPSKRTGGPTLPPPVGAATLSGRVEAGVEPGCLLLDGHLLVGGPRDVLTAGATVTVTGKIEPDMVTTCQQGIPFLVETAARKG
ncbi:hypothetical protein QTQ03_23980 [Micromonospora sp. WMMA1363]|uniref:hypothetical protein n=1 Tax=Micromonospora sp. WMMA1363 TaxID=3053985 RepID=UPI00259D1A98|nr:hypothetical protein [Micromonospora sp. WMMA1363]MDM4722499.1 hypothetical protein [Micromonospora sp. WMMA1363]